MASEKDRGYVHIYCGNGKGKTTTGMGLCLRAAGYGYKVLIYQFMKDNATSERKALARVPGITLAEGLPQEKFSFQMTEEEKSSRRAYYEEQFRAITEKAAREDYDVLFCDELVYAIRAGLSGGKARQAGGHTDRPRPQPPAHRSRQLCIGDPEN